MSFFHIQDTDPDSRPVVLAPMAGISDSPFRRLVRRMGSDFTYTEFVSTDGITRHNTKTMDLFRFLPEERPIIFQIFGNDPEITGQAAKIIEELEPDAIDLNMGCSVRKVVFKGAGAGLLKDLPRAGRMIEAIVKSVRVPVTAKIRLGWNQSQLNYLETARVLQESGVSMIAVHGRTKEQAYGGLASWDPIGEIKARSRVPIFGNGDIKSRADAIEKMTRYDLDGVLIGRGAIGNPWVFSRVGGPTGMEELSRVILEHLDLMAEFYGIDHGLRLFRKHVVKYLKGFSGASELRGSLVREEDPEEFRRVVRAMPETHGELIRRGGMDLAESRDGTVCSKEEGV